MPKRKLSKFEQAILSGGVAELIASDWFVAFDPSSGSRSSQPGFSLWHKGELHSAGLLPVGAGGPIHYRLRKLDQMVRGDAQLQLASVVAVEYIPPLIKGKAAIQLHKAIAVLETAAGTDRQLAVPAVTWRKHLPENYVKTDDHDAVAIGWAVVEAAFRLTEKPMPEPPWRYLTNETN